MDSAIFQKEVRDVAEFLYVLLTDTVICRNAPALIVACNKQGATASPLCWAIDDVGLSFQVDISLNLSCFYRHYNGKIG